MVVSKYIWKGREMSNAETFLLAWAIGATIGCGWVMHDALETQKKCVASLQVANEALKKWRTMIDMVIDGKGKFERIGMDKLKFVEIGNEETK